MVCPGNADWVYRRTQVELLAFDHRMSLGRGTTPLVPRPRLDHQVKFQYWSGKSRQVYWTAGALSAPPWTRRHWPLL